MGVGSDCRRCERVIRLLYCSATWQAPVARGRMAHKKKKKPELGACMCRLAKAGAQVNYYDPEMLQATALHWASTNGHADTVEKLVELGASVFPTNQVRAHSSMLAAAV
eukprot:2421726-Rhodomonas_salina.1